MRYKPPHYKIITKQYSKIRDRDKVLFGGAGNYTTIPFNDLNNHLSLSEVHYYSGMNDFILSEANPHVIKKSYRVFDTNGIDKGELSELNISKLRTDSKYNIKRKIWFKHTPDGDEYELSLSDETFYTIELPKKPQFKLAHQIKDGPILKDYKFGRAKKIYDIPFTYDGDIMVYLKGQLLMSKKDYVVENGKLKITTQINTEQVVRVKYSQDVNYNYHFKEVVANKININSPKIVLYMPDNTHKVKNVYVDGVLLKSDDYVIKDNNIYIHDDKGDVRYWVEAVIKKSNIINLGEISNTLSISWYQGKASDYQAYFEYTKYDDYEYSEATRLDCKSNSFAKLPEDISNGKYRCRVLYIKTVDFVGDLKTFESQSDEAFFTIDKLDFVM